MKSRTSAALMIAASVCIYASIAASPTKSNFSGAWKTYILKVEGVGKDCMPYNPNDLRIVDQWGIWLMTDDRSSRINIFADKRDAKKALALARRHTTQCFIGRDNTKKLSQNSE